MVLDILSVHSLDSVSGHTQGELAVRWTACCVRQQSASGHPQDVLAVSWTAQLNFLPGKCSVALVSRSQSDFAMVENVCSETIFLAENNGVWLD